MTDALADLARHADKLSDDERRRLLAILKRRERGFRSNEYIRRFRPNLTPGHELDNPKAREFLGLTCTEALYGGAAGGSKTDSLLLGALQYVDVPQYAAILFRRTYPDLILPGAIMDRARDWLSDTDARWNGHEKTWTFPSGASLTFGYLDSEKDKFRYGSAEFQYIGFDELTEHPEENYTFLFSRLRRTKGMARVPLRMRSATNPGGPHGQWVKDRFIPQEYLDADEETQFANVWHKTRECAECGATGVLDGEACYYCDGKGSQFRVFVPARAADNPALDVQEYNKSLAEMNVFDRYRLQHGRWDIMEEGDLYRQSWFRYYVMRGDHFALLPPADESGAHWHIVGSDRVEFFCTADFASKAKTVNDWTVICVWALDLERYNVMLVDVLRERMEIPAMFPALHALYHRYNCTCAVVEDAAGGIEVIQRAKARLAIISYNPHTTDKVSRATTMIVRTERGQVFLPAERKPWVDDVVAELVQFKGKKDGVDDIVDNFSMAGWYVNNRDNLEFAGALPEQVIVGPVIGGVGPVGFGRR